MSKSNYPTKDLDLGFKDLDLKQGIVTGYYALFGNKDLDGDILEKGAFTKTLQERFPKGLIKMLLDHDRYNVIAKINRLEQDEKGLYYEAKIGSHPNGQAFLQMVESELINQHSFGFKIVKEQFDQQSKANRIKEVVLYEGSAVQFLGANPDTTTINLKNFDDVIEYLNRLEKFVKTSDCTDETLITLETRLKSLSELLKPSKDTLNEKEADEKIIIDTLKQTFKNYGY